MKNYIVHFIRGLWSLLVGMYTTLRVFFRKKTTERYPENRKQLVMFDRFRGELVLLHDEQNHHGCIACGICETNCPNGTIRLTSEMVTDEAGKKKKVLVEYQYDHGSCIFCQLCVRTCPQRTLAFIPTFEHAVFTREKLVHKLNREGSSVAPKPVAGSSITA
ncbi:MAG: 4Fe-4S dicluster domain-containing protein [Odoribacteraceae bacterium]|jgi:NADH-quinone oxidoreductase subunit I|nr:4Fe-4S dicluster domain-containing protein [Odoribacteraceae bacterium]